MSIGNEIALTCRRELRRNLRSAKGLVAMGLFALGGAGPVLLYLSLNRATGGIGESPARRQALEALYADHPATVTYLMDAPPVLFVLYQTLLVMAPALAILIGYDQIVGEVQHRTLRYTALRAHRSSLVVGKALGAWISTAALAFVLCAGTWAIVIGSGRAAAGPTLSFGVRFWAMGVVFAAAYVGLTTLISSVTRTPTIALLLALGTSLALWVVRLLAHPDSAIRPVAYVIPGTWEPGLLSPELGTLVPALAACLGFGALAVAAACFLLARRDL